MGAPEFVGNVERPADASSREGTVVTNGLTETIAAGGTSQLSVYTNATSDTVYFEQASFELESDYVSGLEWNTSTYVGVEDADGNATGQLSANLAQYPVSFDPPLPIEPSGSITLSIVNRSSSEITYGYKMMVRES